ncbi:unnamed protein product [Timema podura]|uniref:Uncharacterized protein n=1 Tax=Timema podura TaxID=61482 RepID=A0ABN7NNG0_TIMPD|nr:unnamed protein product [Timema podura]
MVFYLLYTETSPVLPTSTFPFQYRACQSGPARCVLPDDVMSSTPQMSRDLSRTLWMLQEYSINITIWGSISCSGWAESPRHELAQGGGPEMGWTLWDNEFNSRRVMTLSERWGPGLWVRAPGVLGRRFWVSPFVRHPWFAPLQNDASRFGAAVNIEPLTVSSGLRHCWANGSIQNYITNNFSPRVTELLRAKAKRQRGLESVNHKQVRLWKLPCLRQRTHKSNTHLTGFRSEGRLVASTHSPWTAHAQDTHEGSATDKQQWWRKGKNLNPNGVSLHGRNVRRLHPEEAKCSAPLPAELPPVAGRERSAESASSFHHYSSEELLIFVMLVQPPLREAYLRAGNSVVPRCKSELYRWVLPELTVEDMISQLSKLWKRENERKM